MTARTQSIAFIGVMTALIAIIAPICITLPFSPIPISFANLIIYICAAITGWKRSSAAVMLYIFTGAAGIPVFTRYAAGIGYILGPTGGYLAGFIFCALCTGIAAEKFPNKKIPLFIGMIIGTILCYALGTIWLMIVMSAEPEKTKTLSEVLFISVFPLIPGDIIKMIISLSVSYEIRKRIKILK